MGRIYSRRFVWHLDAPASEIWALLADTARFNEAAGLPRYVVEEHPQPDGSVRYFTQARMGGLRLAWEELPVDWVSGRWLEHVRRFSRGPLRTLTARLELTQTAGGCRADYTLSAEPAGPLGHLLLAAGFFRSAGRSFARLAAQAADYARGRRATPFELPPRRPLAALARRVDDMVRRIEESGHGHGHTRRLADHVLAGSEVDLATIRPLALARAWEAPAREVVELCLQGRPARGCSSCAGRSCVRAAASPRPRSRASTGCRRAPTAPPATSTTAATSPATSSCAFARRRRCGRSGMASTACSAR